MSGNTLGGGPAEPMPEGWGSNSNRPRVGRVGDWNNAGGSSSRHVLVVVTRDPRNLTGEHRPASGGGARIATFRDLVSGGGSGGPPLPPHSHDDEDDEDERRPEEYFAGGERRCVKQTILVYDGRPLTSGTVVSRSRTPTKMAHLATLYAIYSSRRNGMFCYFTISRP